MSRGRLQAVSAGLPRTTPAIGETSVHGRSEASACSGDCACALTPAHARVTGAVDRRHGDGVPADFVRHVHEVFGDQRAGDGGAEKVFAFVNGARAEHGDEVVGGEFFAEVAHDQLARAAGEGFRLQAGQVFALSDIGAKADDFTAVVFFEPGHNDRGVEAAGVGEDDFLDGVGGVGGHGESFIGKLGICWLVGPFRQKKPPSKKEGGSGP